METANTMRFSHSEINKAFINAGLPLEAPLPCIKEHLTALSDDAAAVKLTPDTPSASPAAQPLLPAGYSATARDVLLPAGYLLPLEMCYSNGHVGLLVIHVITACCRSDTAAPSDVQAVVALSVGLVTRGCGFESRLRLEVSTTETLKQGTEPPTAPGLPTAPGGNISLLIILCIIVYVTDKAHLSLICIVLY